MSSTRRSGERRGRKWATNSMKLLHGAEEDKLCRRARHELFLLPFRNCRLRLDFWIFSLLWITVAVEHTLSHMRAGNQKRQQQERLEGPIWVASWMRTHKCAHTHFGASLSGQLFAHLKVGALAPLWVSLGAWAHIHTYFCSHRQPSQEQGSLHFEHEELSTSAVQKVKHGCPLGDTRSKSGTPLLAFF